MVLEFFINEQQFLLYFDWNSVACEACNCSVLLD